MLSSFVAHVKMTALPAVARSRLLFIVKASDLRRPPADNKVARSPSRPSWFKIVIQLKVTAHKCIEI